MNPAAKRLLSPAFLLPAFLLAAGALLRAPDVLGLGLAASATLDGPSGDSSDWGAAVAADGKGTVFAAGSVKQANVDIWLARYDDSLVLQSSVIVNGSQNAIDFAQDVVIGPGGNVFVLGTIRETVGGANIWLAKYDSSMALLSSVTVNGASNGSDFGDGLDVDASGNVYASGCVNEPVGGNNIWIGTFDNALNLLSSTTFGGTAGGNDCPFGLARGSDGRIHVAGRVTEAGNNSNNLTAVFDAALVQLSSASFDGPVGGGEELAGIAVDSGGNTFVAGFVATNLANGTMLPWIARYDAQLVLQASATIPSPAALPFDYAAAVNVDGCGIVRVGGSITDAAGNSDLVIWEFDSNLVLRTTFTLDGPSAGWDAAAALGRDGLGNLFAAGYIEEPVGDGNIWLGRFDTALTQTSLQKLTVCGASDSELTLSIPGGALSQEAQVTVAPTLNPPAGPTEGASLRSTGVGFSITLLPALQPSRPVPLRMTYPDSAVAGMDETRLLIARYAEGPRVWVPLLSTPNPDDNAVSALLDHFSEFQLMEVVPAESVSAVRTFPNPFRPSAGHTAVTMLNMPAFSRVRLYTTSGELIRDLSANGAGVLVWDVRNLAGGIVAPGVYVGYVQSGDNLRSTFKVAIER